MSFWFRAEICHDGFAQAASDAVAPGYAAPGLRIWSGLPIIALGSAGCIAGYLFRRESPCGRVFELDEPAQRRAIATRGASLLEEFWGGYVALFSDGSGTVYMLRAVRR
ncbi:MAG TPA: hypothetical protein DCF81_10805 [Erythrobacter sp.]|nr:hypothetical protein [Erythrobacter sp.]